MPKSKLDALSCDREQEREDEREDEVDDGREENAERSETEHVTGDLGDEQYKSKIYKDTSKESSESEQKEQKETKLTANNGHSKPSLVIIGVWLLILTVSAMYNHRSPVDYDELTTRLLRSDEFQLMVKKTVDSQGQQGEL